MADHTRGCAMDGSYSVTTCPCCGVRLTPHRRWRRRSPEELDWRLRERPPWPLFDTDGERRDDLD